jgi:hypothetical protein
LNTKAKRSFGSNFRPTTIWRIAKRTIGARIDKQMLAPLDVSVPQVTKRTGKTGGRDL